MKKYSIAKEFFIKNDHLVVPAKYTCEDGMQLGMWVRTQRVAKKNGNLTEEQEHLLNEIGMVWELKPGVKKRTD